MTAHWGILYPASVEGTHANIERAHKHAFAMLTTRISLLLALPLAIKEALDSIGKR